MNSNTQYAGRKIRSAFFSAQRFAVGTLPKVRTFLMYMLVVGGPVKIMPGQSPSDSPKVPLTTTLNQQGPRQSDSENIKRWIDQLGDSTFLVRLSAREKLEKAGETAYAQLYRARNSDDLDIRLAVRSLLSKIKIQWVRPEDSKVVVDLMLEFQSRDWRDRMAIIDRLFWLPADECCLPLYRIALFDQSDPIQSYAAARLLQACFLRDQLKGTNVQSEYRRVSNRRYLSVGNLLDSDAAWGEKIIAVGFKLNDQESLLSEPAELLEQALELQKNRWDEYAAIPDRSEQSRLTRESLLLSNQVLFQSALANRQSFDSQSTTDSLAGIERLMVQVVESGDTTEWVNTLVRFLQAKRFSAGQRLVDRLSQQKDPVYGVWNLELLRRSKGISAADEAAIQWVSKMPGQIDLLTDCVERLLEWGLDHWLVFLLNKQPEKSMTTYLEVTLADAAVRTANWEIANTAARDVFAETQSTGDKLNCARILSDVSRGKGNSVEEEKWLREMLRIDPLNVDALIRFQTLSSDLTNFDSEFLEQKLKIAKGAYRDQVRMNSQMAQSSKPAEANLGKTKLAKAAHSLARLLAHLNEDTDEALRSVRLAVKLEPYNPNFLETLAFVESRRGNTVDAAAILRRAVFVSPNDFELRERLRKYEQN